MKHNQIEFFYFYLFYQRLNWHARKLQGNRLSFHFKKNKKTQFHFNFFSELFHSISLSLCKNKITCI